MAAIPPPPTPMCPDWVFSNNSNVHVAKDRGWFTDYTPFESTVGDIYGMSGMPVAGIGTVELPTKRSPNLSGAKSHGVLRLVDVLHTPSGFCNVIGGPLMDDYDVLLELRGNMSKGLIKDKGGRHVAYFDRQRPLYQVKLRGPPVGPTVFERDTVAMVNVQWSDSERQRWEEHRAAAARYTDEEKKWLKENHGGEFRFLRDYGLSIYKDEDREEGRLIVRAMMRDGSEEEEGEDEDDEDGSELSLDAHMSDYHFSEAELKFIKKGYGNSTLFMQSFGLKFYNEEDCQEAQMIVRSFMADDEERMHNGVEAGDGRWSSV